MVGELVVLDRGVAVSKIAGGGGTRGIVGVYVSVLVCLLSFWVGCVFTSGCRWVIRVNELGGLGGVHVRHRNARVL